MIFVGSIILFTVGIENLILFKKLYYSFIKFNITSYKIFYLLSS